MSRLIVLSKKLTKQLGIYHFARSLYRRVSPMVREIQQRDAEIYSRFMGAGTLVFDVGGNLGQKSEPFLKLGARVICFEPNPNCHPILDRKFGTNPMHSLIKKAVGRVPGQAEFHFSGTAPESSLRADWEELQRFEHIDKTDVEITTLDREIATHGLPEFCKIDVEGFEIEVLSGLTKTPKTITFEFVKRDPEATLACLNRLAELGYRTANTMPHVGDFDHPEPIPMAQMITRVKDGQIQHRFGDIFCFA